MQQQQLLITEDRIQAESLARGKLAIAIGPTHYRFEPFIKAGINYRFGGPSLPPATDGTATHGDLQGACKQGAAICGIRTSVYYEGQAAIELEAACDPDEDGSYSCSYIGPKDSEGNIMALVQGLNEQ